MAKFLSGDPPKKKKPSPNIEQAMAATVARPDALPARPSGPGLNEYRQKPIPLPMRAPTAKSDYVENLPNLLDWQQGFFDTLSTMAGVPGEIVQAPQPGPVFAYFTPRGQRIAFGGNLGQFMGADPKEIRSAAGHEWGHLLAHNDDRILKAFMNAAPLPKKLNTRVSGVSPQVQKKYDDLFSVQWEVLPELPAGEAFADMFSDALSKHLPEMYGPERGNIHYSFTDQFRGRSRQRMVDSLVNTLLPRLKQ